MYKSSKETLYVRFHLVLTIVKTTKKKKKQNFPIFKKITLNLDSTFTHMSKKKKKIKKSLENRCARLCLSLVICL